MTRSADNPVTRSAPPVNEKVAPATNPCLPPRITGFQPVLIKRFLPPPEPNNPSPD
jgi:hypothetical protein